MGRCKRCSWKRTTPILEGWIQGMGERYKWWMNKDGFWKRYREGLDFFLKGKRKTHRLVDE